METDEGSRRVLPFQLQFDKPPASQVNMAEWNSEKDLLLATEDSKGMKRVPKVVCGAGKELQLVVVNHLQVIRSEDDHIAFSRLQFQLVRHIRINVMSHESSDASVLALLEQGQASSRQATSFRRDVQRDYN